MYIIFYICYIMYILYMTGGGGRAYSIDIYYIFAGPTAQWRVRPRATIHLSNQLPVSCYLFQILFTVSVRGAQPPRIVVRPMILVAPGRAQGPPEEP